MTISIGVFGHVGNGNQGDESVIAATIQNIKRRCPDGVVLGFTLQPRDTESRHGIRGFPIRRPRRERSTDSSPSPGTVSRWRLRQQSARQHVKRIARVVPLLYTLLIRLRAVAAGVIALPDELAFLVRSYRSLKSLHLLIVAGSQQCNDFVDGPWGLPLTLFKWAILCRLAKTKLAFVSVGAGPLCSRSGRFLVRHALRLAAYRSFRDRRSRDLVRALGIRGEVHVLPDLVYSLRLPPPSPRASAHPRAGSRLTIGINPLPLDSPFYWNGYNEAAHARYVSILAAFAAWLLRGGHAVVLFPTQLRVDPPVVQEVRLATKRLADSGTEERLSVPTVESFDALIATLSTLDLAVVTRFHGVVLSHLLGTPAIAIAYHEKTQEVMRAVGHADYVIPVQDLNEEWLARCFSSMSEHLPTSRREIEDATARMRTSLDRQYDRVLALARTQRPK